MDQPNHHGGGGAGGARGHGGSGGHSRSNSNNNANSNNHHNHRSANFELILGGVLKVPIAGRKSSASTNITSRRKLLKRLQKTYLGYGDQNLYSSRQFVEGSNKYEEFFCYNENEAEADPEAMDGDDENSTSDQDDDDLGHRNRTQKSAAAAPSPISLLENISINIVDLLGYRELGNMNIPINLQYRIGSGSSITGNPESGSSASTSPGGSCGSSSSISPRCPAPGTLYQSQPDFPIKHLLINGILQEKPIRVENLNKVFCSQWLSDRSVIFGTKCNKLMVLDVQTKHLTQIPSLAPSPRSLSPDQQCGIHSIEINPSRTLLATGGKNPNDLAIYKLPTMDPYCVGELAHSDWVFAQAWLDDQFLVSGSRDTSLALWKIPDEDEHEAYSTNSTSPSSSLITKKSSRINSKSDELDKIPSHFYIKAAAVKECKSAQKVRDIVFNRKLQEIACVSLNGYIHVWAADRFVQKFSRKLPFCLENVCMGVHEDYGLYAVGSKSHTTLMDARTIQCVKKIPSKYSGYGIRSTSFYSSLLSIGTGQGTVMFYDLRAAKYLESNINSARSAILRPSSGWTYPEEEFLVEAYRNKYLPAVYTHCIDRTGTRIFTAGGPLPITLCGNYIGLWH